MSEELLKIGRVYRHHQGDLYTVLMTGHNLTNSANNEKMVVYRSHTLEKINIRELQEFIEPVTWPDGKIRPRFVLNETLKNYSRR